jgi:hypothetical protein
MAMLEHGDGEGIVMVDPCVVPLNRGIQHSACNCGYCMKAPGQKARPVDPSAYVLTLPPRELATEIDRSKGS